MYQKDMERFAFMYLCKEQDRKILVGKEKMRFEDFERLDYLTNALEFGKFNQELWEKYSMQFCEKFDALKTCFEESKGEEKSIEVLEDEIQRREMWMKEFCKQAPKEAAEILCVELLENWER